MDAENTDPTWMRIKRSRRITAAEIMRGRRRGISEDVDSDWTRKGVLELGLDDEISRRFSGRILRRMEDSSSSISSS